MVKSEEKREKAKSLCKNYLGAKKMLKTALSSIESMNEKLNNASTEKEKLLISYAIERRNSEIIEAKAVIEEFERCLITLPEEERMVIDQIYGKGCKWIEVKNNEGKILLKNDVIPIWKRAIRKIARLMRPEFIN